MLRQQTVPEVALGRPQRYLRKSPLRFASKESLLELSEAAVEAIRDALKDSDTKIRLQAAKLVLGMMKEGKPKE